MKRSAIPQRSQGCGGRDRSAEGGLRRGSREDAEVVDTLTVTLLAELLRLTELEEIEQVECEGAPEQLMLTVPVRPSREATLKE